jgi:hypothetical protein
MVKLVLNLVKLILTKKKVVLYIISTPSDPKKESESEFCKHTLELFTSSTNTPHGVN